MIRLFAILLALITSSANADGPTPLAGHWQTTEDSAILGTVVTDLILGTDGTFKESITLAGDQPTRFSGTWSATADALNYEYLSSDLPTVPKGFKDKNRIIQLTGDTLTVETKHGAKRTFRRQNT